MHNILFMTKQMGHRLPCLHVLFPWLVQQQSSDIFASMSFYCRGHQIIAGDIECGHMNHYLLCTTSRIVEKVKTARIYQKCYIDEPMEGKGLRVFEILSLL